MFKFFTDLLTGSCEDDKGVPSPGETHETKPPPCVGEVQTKRHSHISGPDQPRSVRSVCLFVRSVSFVDQYELIEEVGGRGRAHGRSWRGMTAASLTLRWIFPAVALLGIPALALGQPKQEIAQQQGSAGIAGSDEWRGGEENRDRRQLPGVVKVTIN